MRIRKLGVASVAMLAALSVSAVVSAQDEEMTRDQKLSYMIGMDIGQEIKNRVSGFEMDNEMFFQAIRDVFEGNETALTEQQKEAIKQDFLQERQAAMQQAATQASEANIAAGREFMAANGQKEGVMTTPSGLQYEVIEEGEGPSPSATDRVTVHYRGTLLDGTEFDSSYSRGQPITFALNGVIPGWTEGLQTMKVGGKSRLFIPSELAYGERGAGGAIGPHSTLIFEVELVGIEGSE